MSLPVAETVGAVSFGPIAKSQSPPPAWWSGKPRYLDVEPSCVTLKALQPAGTPIGPITYALPYWSVRMLGSAAPLLPFSNRLGLKVPAAVSAAALAAELEAFAVVACRPNETAASVPTATAVRVDKSRILRTCLPERIENRLECLTTALLVGGFAAKDLRAEENLQRLVRGEDGGGNRPGAASVGRAIRRERGSGGVARCRCREIHCQRI